LFPVLDSVLVVGCGLRTKGFERDCIALAGQAEKGPHQLAVAVIGLFLDAAILEIGNVFPLPFVVAEAAFFPKLAVFVIGDIVPVEFAVLERFLILELTVAVEEAIFSIQLTGFIIIFQLPHLPVLVITDILAHEFVVAKGPFLPELAVMVIGNCLSLPETVLKGQPGHDLAVAEIGEVFPFEFPVQGLAAGDDLPFVVMDDLFL
jgi:hypothetical protein